MVITDVDGVTGFSVKFVNIGSTGYYHYWVRVLIIFHSDLFISLIVVLTVFKEKSKVG